MPILIKKEKKERISNIFGNTMPKNDVLRGHNIYQSKNRHYYAVLVWRCVECAETSTLCRIYLP